MKTELCHREDELLDALAGGFVGAELESHVGSCASCAELRLTAGALLDDRAEAMLAAPVPSAGAMWFRIRARQRHDAESTARRSLLIGQAATLTIAIALLLSFFGSDVAITLRQIAAAVRVSTPLLVALAMWLVLAPLAGWVAIRQK